MHFKSKRYGEKYLHSLYKLFKLPTIVIVFKGWTIAALLQLGFVGVERRVALYTKHDHGAAICIPLMKIHLLSFANFTKRRVDWNQRRQPPLPVCHTQHFPNKRQARTSNFYLTCFKHEQHTVICVYCVKRYFLTQASLGKSKNISFVLVNNRFQKHFLANLLSKLLSNKPS